MKNVTVSFKQLCEFIKSKLTAKITYNIMVYKGYKDYPTVSVDNWLFDTYAKIKEFRKKELDELCTKKQEELLLCESIISVRPIIQKYLNEHKKFTTQIINNLKEDMNKLLNNKDLVNKIMSNSLTKLLESDFDIQLIKNNIKEIQDLNTEDKRSEHILSWMSGLKQESPR